MTMLNKGTGQETYLTVDMYGNIGFGFSVSQWEDYYGVLNGTTASPPDPGCGGIVVDNINATVGQQNNLTFQQIGSGTEHGGNWDYTLQSVETGEWTWANAMANTINSGQGVATSGYVYPPGTRASPGGTGSPHAPNAAPFPAGGGNFGVQINNAHNDTFNANSGVAGLAGHGTVDWFGGNILQAWGSSLGCH